MIVLGEYRYGIAHSRDRKHYEEWLTAYLSRFRILDVDEETTLSYRDVRTELKKPERLSLPTTFGLRRYAASIGCLCLAATVTLTPCRGFEGWRGKGKALFVG